VRTLPLLLLQRMSSYRTADAAGLAGLLAILCLGLIWAADAAFGRARR
jgi:thiamine transport system permease protein